MAAKTISAWAGVALLEGALLTMLGPWSAVACAVPLIVYGLWERPEVAPLVKRWRLSKRTFLLTASIAAIVVVGFDAWRSYYEPYRVANLITLFERDPESWPGHIHAEGPFRLDENIDPPLEIAVRERRRFNPQLGVSENADNLFGLTVLIRFPADAFNGDGAIVAAPDPDGTQAWGITESRDGSTINYFAPFGDYAKGDSGAPFSSFFTLTPSMEGPFEVTYEIRGRAETVDGVLPLTRSFDLTITP